MQRMAFFAKLEEGVELAESSEEVAAKSPKKSSSRKPDFGEPAKNPGTVDSKFEENDDEQDSFSTEETSDPLDSKTEKNDSAAEMNSQDGDVGMADVALQVTAAQEKGRPRSGSQLRLKQRASGKGLQESIVLKSQEVQELLTLQDTLESKNTQLLTQVMKIRTELMVKSDQFFKEQQKAEDAEEAFGKSSMDQRVLMDENFSLKYERDRLAQERDDVKADLLSITEEKDEFKKKALRLEELYQDEVENIRNEERSKLDTFMSQAREAISDRPGTSSQPQSKADRFQQPTTFSNVEDELKQTKLDNVKLKQTLQEKVEEYVEMKLKAFQGDDINKRLEEQVKRKDIRLRGQHNELAALGELKAEAGKFHYEIISQMEGENTKLKKDNKELKRQVMTLREKQKHGSNVERDEAGYTVKKKLKTMVMPIRGGGKKGKKRKKKKTMTKEQMLGMHPGSDMPMQQQQMQNSFNNYLGHGKSPSMMNAGFYAPPQQTMNSNGMLYQPAFGDVGALGQFDQQIQIESMPPTDDLPDIPDFQNQQPQGQIPAYFTNPYANSNVPHGRNNTFIEQTNFW